MSSERQRRGARTAWIVIAALMIVGVGMGFVLYFKVFKTYSHEDTALLSHMEEVGAELTAEECVDTTLTWFDTCESPVDLCLKSLTRGMVHCLQARDRTDECAPFIDDQRTGKWTFRKCKERGVDKSSAKPLRKSCTQAWDALDHFCKSGQKGAIL